MTVQRKTAFGDSIRNAPGHRTKKRMPFEILIELVEAQHYISHLAVSIRHAQLGDNCAIGGNFRDHSPAVAQREELDCRPVLRLAPRLFLDSRHVSSFVSRRAAMRAG